jgi:putative FmdB family regulatory protein
MPLYEYYCEKCDSVFEALRSFSASDQPAKCPTCGGEADRIMPTTFASMSKRQGLRERVPFHHHDVRDEQPKKTIARVKPKVDGAKPAPKPARKTKQKTAKD